MSTNDNDHRRDPPMDEPPSQRRRRSALDSDSDNDDNNNNASARATRMQALARRRRRQQQQQRDRAAELREEVVALAGDGDTFSPVPDARPVLDDDDDRDIHQRDDNDDDDSLYADDTMEDRPRTTARTTVRAADPDDDDDDDGEDLMEDAQRDYQRIAALDTYGTEGLDDSEYDALTVDQRRAVEAELARRDGSGTNRRSDGFYGRLDNDDADGEDEEARMARRGAFGGRMVREDEEGEDGMDEDEEDEDLDGEDQVNLEAFDVPLREWIAQDRTRRQVQRRFRAFLKHFTPSDAGVDTVRRRRGNGLYEHTIRTMCAANACSLVISYAHLHDAEPILAYWLADAPKDLLQVLDEAATRHTLSLFPAYGAIQNRVHVRISHVPILDSLRDLRRSHLDCLVKVHGVVTRRSTVYPQLHVAYYTCTSCRSVQGPFVANGDSTHTPDECGNCQGAYFKLHPTMSVYRNLQRLTLQETPGSVPPGRVPRSKQVLLADDLMDVVRPGHTVELTGIYEHAFDYSLTIKSGFPVFSTLLVANHVAQRDDDDAACHLTEADVRDILQLSKDPHIGERIVQSIAPSIFGHDFSKRALAMALFGGVPKNVNDKHRVRGDVNVLLLGDPGTAKSQLLKYAEKTAPRAVYSTGKGASAVGLTASVHKDPVTREWTLEGGALVLADKGVCLIDEFDKMNEQDRTSIHEAMEQQSISISKAGIVTSLQARCSVIAAANPIGGRYDSANTLADNVELTDPILQRFDILCVLQDTVDPVADERLARFVTGSHMRSVPTRDLASRPPTERTVVNGTTDRPLQLIPQDLLRKYIQYARTNIRPVLRSNGFDQEKVSSLYVELRRESAASGGVPIAVRHIESIMRMAEAHAKMHLRDYVRDDDVDISIRQMLGSFIDGQKFSVRRALKRSFARFITSGEDRAHLLLHILQDMFRKEQMYQVIRQRQRNQMEDVEQLDVPLDELESRARERKIFDVSEFCKSSAFEEAGYVYDDHRGIISRAVA